MMRIHLEASAHKDKVAYAFDWESWQQHRIALFLLDGTVADIDLLPQDLSMPPHSSVPGTEYDEAIKLGPLEFDYETVRLGLENGTKKLRLLIDGNAVVGFYVVTPQTEVSIINQLWVCQEHRRKGLGQKLLNDAIATASQRLIIMDVRGGDPMIHLAVKMGFARCNYPGMAQPFCLQN